MIQDCIRSAVGGDSLTQAQAEEVMQEILEGQASPAQIAGLAVALRMKGETVDELTGFAKVMRAKGLSVPHKHPVVLDTCGTGADGSKTFSISTTTALVAAGAGVVVAKHGNRAMSSSTGSADVLQALGVAVELTEAQVGRCIDEIGMGFMFAQAFHPAMRHAAAPRRELGVRTFFNLLGPLSNPAGAKRQIVGVFDGDFVEPVAEVLARLGTEHAWVVHGLDGMDELSTCDETRVAEVKGAKVRSFYVNAGDLGIEQALPRDLAGGDAQTNARMTLAVLKGEKGPHRDIVLLNAAAALLVAGAAESIQAALPLAVRSIDSGAAAAKLDALKRLSSSFT
ncbi:MAG TPA: anthranilate phosphoribosyltransferase [bacterium]|jgi:anthranilate phosphoribosyltransferase|nr:anthranilate phosphoribosyltransferase [bacterium]